MTNFTLSTIQKGIKEVPLKALIYGANGVGKSHFATEFPSPIFMDIERNIDHLDISKQRISSWQDALDFVRFLQTEKHNFKTLVVDSLDQLQNYGAKVACEQVKVQNLNEGYGKAIVALASLFEEFRQECDELFEKKSMNLIFISHAKKIQVNDLNQGTYHMITPALHDRVAPLFLDWCNLVGYAHRLMEVNEVKDLGFDKTQVKLKEQTDSRIGSRVLRVTDTPSVLAKETFNLKTEAGNFPLKADTLLKHISNFYNKAKGE